MPVIVVHSAESGSLDGTVQTLRGSGNLSHEVWEIGGDIVQLVPLDRPAKALMHSGWPETNNRLGVIQIELVAYASRSSANGNPGLVIPDLDDDQLRWVGVHLQALCAETGTPFVFPLPFVAYPESYGAANGVRLDAQGWLAIDGIIGHEHVVENVHGDPGALDTVRMLALLLPPPVGDPIIVLPPPVSEETDMPYLIIRPASDTGAWFCLYASGAARHVGGSEAGWLIAQHVPVLTEDDVAAYNELAAHAGYTPPA
jgi:hypothetical protein